MGLRASIWLAILLTGSAASAGSMWRTCDLVELDYFAIDGRIDDWSSIRYTSVGSGDDAVLKLRCAYDKDNLYLALDVVDDRLIRTRQGRKQAEDHVTVELWVVGRKLKFSFLPGSATGKRKLITGKSRMKWLQVEDSLQPKGFSVEVALPRKKIPGVGRGTPALNAAITFSDTDRATAGKIQRTRRFAGRLYLEAGVRAYRALKSKLRLRNKDITLDRLADVDPVAGAERVVAGGRYVGVVSDEFSYMQLPVKSAKDIKKLQLIDFDGDGRSFLVGHYRQYGGGGAREVVSIWELKGDGSFLVVLAFEVLKELQGAKLSNRWTLVPRGKLRQKSRRESKRGFDLLVEAEAATGIDSSNWNEMPATDVQPIILPWADEKAVLYHFDGNVAHMTTPKTPRDSRKRKRRRR